MEHYENYILWGIIIVLTSYGINLLRKKNYSKTKVFFLVFFPIWIVVGILNAILSNEFYGAYEIFGMIVQTLPMMILISVPTFFYKYYKSKRQIK